MAFKKQPHHRFYMLYSTMSRGNKFINMIVSDLDNISFHFFFVSTMFYLLKISWYTPVYKLKRKGMAYMTTFINSLKNRRSIYHLGKETPLNEEQIEDIVKEVVKESPTAFNSQTQRVIFLFNDAHHKLWDITESALKPLTPTEVFPSTQEKLKGFADGKGTLLFFEDTDIVKGLQEQFPLYADNFPIWSEQASGLTQTNVWTALSDENIGANLQHYNPIIDEAVAKEWSIPSSWKLKAQLVIGSIKSPALEKEYMDSTNRFKTFK